MVARHARAAVDTDVPGLLAVAAEFAGPELNQYAAEAATAVAKAARASRPRRGRPDSPAPGCPGMPRNVPRNAANLGLLSTLSYICGPQSPWYTPSSTTSITFLNRRPQVRILPGHPGQIRALFDPRGPLALDRSQPTRSGRAAPNGPT
jgi:hypothetical protein